MNNNYVKMLCLVCYASKCLLYYFFSSVSEQSELTFQSKKRLCFIKVVFFNSYRLRTLINNLIFKKLILLMDLRILTEVQSYSIEI